ncbi:RN150 protein, partial [Polyodon spathula]|nr:RN150 protein [Polyodon spathula]
MAVSLIQTCRSLALSTWLFSFCFVHLLCLDFTVAEKEEWYTAFVNITYVDPVSAETRTEKTECGRYGEHSLKQDTKGVVVMPSFTHDRLACDPNTKFAVPANAKSWVALIPKGNCTYKDKIRHATSQNASAVVIFNVGSSNVNETITMPHAENLPGRGQSQCGFTPPKEDPRLSTTPPYINIYVARKNLCHWEETSGSCRRDGPHSRHTSNTNLAKDMSWRRTNTRFHCSGRPGGIDCCICMEGINVLF